MFRTDKSKLKNMIRVKNIYLAIIPQEIVDANVNVDCAAKTGFTFDRPLTCSPFGGGLCIANVLLHPTVKPRRL
jgi:hypothetical protein